MTNRVVGKTGAGLTGLAVIAFSVSMIFGLFTESIFASCFASMFIALGFILFMSGLVSVNNDKNKSASGKVCLVCAAIYATLIFIVYFSQCTTINLHPELDDEVREVIDYGKTGSLFFNYDLLGYGFMALSTFFAGFLVDKSKKCGKPLSIMLKIHGVFFPSCLFIPMFPVFVGNSGETVTGTILLEFWCVFFMPICIMGYRYFGKNAKEKG